MKIYLDVVMIENFIVNTFLLCITLKLMRVNIVKSKIILSSLIGTIYTLVMIFPKLLFFSKIPFQVLVAFIMIKILIFKSNFQSVLKATMIYLMLSLMLAGACFKISEMSNKFSLSSKYKICNITAGEVVIALIIVYSVVVSLYSYLKDKFIIKDLLYDVEITINGTKYKLKGFLDTGNGLVEPVTKLPCIIVEDKSIGGYIEMKNYYNIPYSVVGSKGMLKGYKTDNIRIKNPGGTWKSIQAMICPCKQAFSNFNDYNALLSRGIL